MRRDCRRSLAAGEKALDDMLVVDAGADDDTGGVVLRLPAIFFGACVQEFTRREMMCGDEDGGLEVGSSSQSARHSDILGQLVAL